MMEPIRKLADVHDRHDAFNVHELRHFITERFQESRLGGRCRFSGELWIQVWPTERQ